MSEPLGVAEVRALLREIVAEFPDGYAYEGAEWRGQQTCVYAFEGKPSCLIGHLFHRLNIEIPEWHQNARVARVVPVFAWGVFTNDAVLYMTNVQQSQDARFPWAECLKLADNLMLDLELSRTADVAPEATL